MNLKMQFHAIFGYWPHILASALALFATPGVGAPSGGAPSGGSPSPSPTPAGTPSPAPGAQAVPAVPGAPASGAPPASPTGEGGLPSNAPNLDALRSSHELVARLGGPEKAQAAFAAAQRYEAVRTEAVGLAERLGYTAESLEAAFAQDPVEVMSFLRGEAAKASRTDPNAPPPDINTVLDKRLGPLENQLRMQQVEKTNGHIDAELGKVFGEHAIFKGKSDIPADVQSFVYDLTREYLKYDTAGLKKMVSGDMGPVKVAFDSAIDRMFKMVNAYTSWQAKGGQPAAGSGQPASGQPGAGGQPSNGGFSLNDLIDGKEDAFQHMASTRR